MEIELHGVIAPPKEHLLNINRSLSKCLVGSAIAPRRFISIFSCSLLTLEINVFHLHLHSKPSPLMQLRTVQTSRQTGTGHLISPFALAELFDCLFLSLWYARTSPARSQNQPADPSILRSATIRSSSQPICTAAQFLDLLMRLRSRTPPKIVHT
jgi:hypothetical protein